MTKSGRRCRGRIRKGSDFCPFHDPNVPEALRRQNAAKGGRSHHRLAHLPDGYLRKLTSRAAVGEVDHPRIRVDVGHRTALIPHLVEVILVTVTEEAETLEVIEPRGIRRIIREDLEIENSADIINPQEKERE